MIREKQKELVIDIYQEFYRAVSLNHNFLVNLNRIDEIVLEKYMDYIDKVYNLNTVDIDFFINWIESGFNYWFDIKTKFGKGFIMFSWIFGKKAIERYEKIKGKDVKLARFSRKIHKEVGINIQNKYRVTNVNSDSNLLYKKLSTETNVSEETIKERHLNKTEGFVTCIMHTTLYNHKSSFCLKCIYTEMCKESLKENYPKIYKVRGYES